MQDAGGKKEMRFKAGEALISAAGQEIAGICRTYAEVEPGEALALVGSGGHLEIAVREGNAAQKLGLRLGDTVVLRPR